VTLARQLHTAVVVDGSAACSAARIEGVVDDDGSEAHDLDEVGDTPSEPLRGRIVLFGGGCEGESGRYAATKYQTLSDIPVLDFDHDWTNPCPPVEQLRSLMAEQLGTASAVFSPPGAPRPSKPAPVRYMKPSNWRIDGAFDPVEPMTREAKGERLILQRETVRMLAERLHDDVLSTRRKRLEALQQRLEENSRQQYKEHLNRAEGKKDRTGKKLTADELEKFTTRMKQAQEVANQKRDLLLASMGAKKHGHCRLTSQDMAGSIDRLHTQAMRKQEVAVSKVRETMTAAATKAAGKRGKPKKLTSKETADVNERLFKEAVQKRKTKHDLLLQRYAPDPSPRKLTSEEAAAVTTRLYNK